MASQFSVPTSYRPRDVSVPVPRAEMTEDSAGSGAEGRPRRKFARTAGENDNPIRKTSGVASTTKPLDQRQGFAARRRSVREHKAPLGPRPMELSNSKRVVSDASAVATNRSFLPSTANESFFNSAVAQGSNPRYSFGKSSDGSKDLTDSSGAYDFLPSINFDDFHASITTAPPYEPELSDFPVPGRGGLFGSSMSGIGETAATAAAATGQDTSSTVTPELKPAEGRVTRSQSLVRKVSEAKRQNPTTNSSGMPPPSAPLSVRTRRQSQFPAPTPAPAAQRAPSRSPRKSIGPGVLPTGRETRTPSSNLSSDIPQPSLGRTPSLSKGRYGQSANNVAAGTEIPRVNTTVRSLKAKSLQPALANSGLRLNLSTSMTPDHASHASIASARSPGKSPGQGNNTPQSASSKRQSMMPHHATGLGARTISPTDARRMKRMSMMPSSPALPSNLPTTPQPEPTLESRALTYSPATAFRKSVTPSSSNRGTPIENNRKSVHSGLSLSSSSSISSLRPVNSALPVRSSHAASSSRLPAPKSRSLHTAAGGDEEEVPPVPAIPKAYGSPKELQDPPMFPFEKFSESTSVSTPDSGSASETTRNSDQGNAVTSNFNGSGSLNGATTGKKTRGSVHHRRGLTVGSSEAEAVPAVQNTKKRNLQPLRLPPLNLLPLSTPTAARVASFPVPSAEVDRRATTPPPKRLNAKTPSTPMTASKATFFSRRDHNDSEQGFLRSSSSHYALRSDATTYPNPTTSAMPIPAPNRRDTATTPFASASLPKNSGEYGFVRSRPSAEYKLDDSEVDVTFASLGGPVSHPVSKKESSSAHTSTSTEPETPSSGSSLRRKLSLGWKRSSSKASHASHPSQSTIAAQSRPADGLPPQPPKHGEMPPPLLPASASASSLSQRTGSPTPSKHRSSLDVRRRKPSMTLKSDTESEKAPIYSRKQSSTVQPPPAYTEKQTAVQHAPRSSSILTPMQQILGSKSSVSTLKARNLDTNLDKDDLAADEEMKKLAGRRKDFEHAAKELDELRKRAKPSEKATPATALTTASLNIFERGEIIDFTEVYFCGTKNARKHVGDLNAQSANFGYDDDRGDYNIVLGDHLKYRYEVVDILGKGSFGQVVRCVDHKSGSLVAVKIIRNKKRFHQQALVEVNILQKLREWDPHNKHSMINFTESFYFRGHLCISTELLGMNLYEFIKAHDFKGFSLRLIRRFTKQILSSLVLLQGRRVIHCDLKPENILIAHPLHSEIKVIDFGSSCFENEKVYTYIQSRFYRSPEVILGMSYGMPIDMWSLGCILAELLTGYPIFPGENEQEQLACIMEIFGPPEKHLIEKSSRKKLFFDSLGKPRVTVSSKGRRRRPSSKTLQQALKCDDEPFLDFISRCLRWDPDRRMKPDEAMHHEFITQMRRSGNVSRPRAPLSSAAAPTGQSGPSPMKRFVPSQTPQRTRPLPEPPATSFKNGNPVSSQAPREMVSMSPIKTASTAPARRHSTIHGPGNTIGVKRASNGTALGGATSSGDRIPSSGLPRVAQRSASGKPDLASAAAIASLRPR